MICKIISSVPQKNNELDQFSVYLETNVKKIFSTIGQRRIAFGNLLYLDWHKDRNFRFKIAQQIGGILLTLIIEDQSNKVDGGA